MPWPELTTDSNQVQVANLEDHAEVAGHVAHQAVPGRVAGDVAAGQASQADPADRADRVVAMDVHLAVL